jgi:hypothetical protein
MVIEFISLLLTMAELFFLFLKGMTGALAPFSYLVRNNGRCGYIIGLPFSNVC